MLNLLDGTEVQEVLLDLLPETSWCDSTHSILFFFSIFCVQLFPLPLDDLFPDLSLVFFIRDGSPPPPKPDWLNRPYIFGVHIDVQRRHSELLGWKADR